MSAVKSKSAITDLSRIILSSHFGDYGSPNIISKKGKDEPRSQYLGQIVQIAQDLIDGEFNSILSDNVLVNGGPLRTENVERRFRPVRST